MPGEGAGSYGSNGRAATSTMLNGVELIASRTEVVKRRLEQGVRYGGAQPMYYKYGLIKPGRAEGGTAPLSHILPGCIMIHCAFYKLPFPERPSAPRGWYWLKAFNGGCQRGGRARIWEGQEAL